MLSPSPSAAQPRFLNIDALRALAALLVVWMHTTEVFVPLIQAGQVGGLWFYSLARSMEFGSVGVVAFFAVSGFVIPASLRGRPKGLAIRNFAISRFFRLYPAFWISVVPGAFVHYWLWGRAFSLQDLLGNLTMLPELLGVQPAQGLYWTLAIELAFYALCVLLFAAGWLHRAPRLIAVCFALLLAFCVFRRTEYANVFAHLSTMFFGAMCRQFIDSPAPRTRCLLGAAIGIVLCFWLLFMPGYGVWAITTGRAAPAYSGFFISYALGIALFGMALVLPGMRKGVWTWLGQISFSIYLLHPVVFYPLLWLVKHSPLLQSLHLHLGVYLLAAMLITIALAAASFYWVEKPAIACGQRLRHRLTPTFK